MIPMRRSERQVTDLVAIQAIVAACRVCRLAVWDREGPYIVPMSFGALWEGGESDPVLPLRRPGAEALRPAGKSPGRL